MLNLSSPFFELTVHPHQPSFSVSALPEGYPRIQGGRIFARCRADGRIIDPLVEGWSHAVVDGPSRIDDPQHGPLVNGKIYLPPGRASLSVAVEFALPIEAPLCLWRLSLTNAGGYPVQVDTFTLLDATKGQLSLADSESGAYRFYANGWQSWSYSGSYAAGDQARRSHLGPIQSPLCKNSSTPSFRGRGRFSSDFFGVLTCQPDPIGLLAGFLSQREMFGWLEADLTGAPALALKASADGIVLQPGSTLASDWACLVPLSLHSAQPLDPYLITVAREYGVEAFPPAPVGWCSWYHFYNKVTAADIRQNLAALVDAAPRLPLELVQIDDGFESQVGDWFSFRPGFPEGVAPLAGEIRAAGRTPGLWLAPFILHPAARLVRDHPDWVLRSKGGRPVNAGFVWDRFTTALDLSVPQALDYACRVVHTAANDWDFPYLKLDFLYAGGLAGCRADPTLTRAQVLRRGLEALRLAAGPQTFLVGCGSPLGSSIGLFEAMRIGPDVSGEWRPSHYNIRRPFRDEPSMPSARSALASILSRAPLHRRWWINDPDCLLVREESRLTLAEIHSLATAMALTGGSLLLSDNLPTLTPDRLRIAQVLLPPIDCRAQVPDLFTQLVPTCLRLDLDGPAGEWSLLARFNWGDEPIETRLTLEEYGLLELGERWAVEFWSQKIVRLLDGVSPTLVVPAHGVVLLAVRRVAGNDSPLYLGSDLHISQGLELSRWEHRNPGELTLHFTLPRSAEGALLLSLPSAPRQVKLDGHPHGWEEVEPGCYRIPVVFDRQAGLQVFYDEG